MIKGKVNDSLSAHKYLLFIFLQTEGKTREEEEKMLNLTDEMSFQLQTLELRLERHCDLAPVRYQNMVKALKADSRLATIEE